MSRNFHSNKNSLGSRLAGVLPNILFFLVASVPVLGYVAALGDLGLRF